MCLLFCMTFGAVIPLLAAWCTDRDLGIEDMFTGKAAFRFRIREAKGCRTICLIKSIDVAEERG
jgi:hypothetical protein